MKCPKCGHKSKCVRTTNYLGLPRRRRRCLGCPHRWWTIERVEGQALPEAPQRSPSDTEAHEFYEMARKFLNRRS